MPSYNSMPQDVISRFVSLAAESRLWGCIPSFAYFAPCLTVLCACVRARARAWCVCVVCVARRVRRAWYVCLCARVRACVRGVWMSGLACLPVCMYTVTLRVSTLGERESSLC